MALAGPQLVLRPDDEGDVDFFDQLADDLGQRSDGLLQNFEEDEEEAEGEVGLEEVLSKLCHGDHTAPAADTFISGDEIWMQERVPNRTLYVNPAVAAISGLIDATREMSEADAASYLNEFVSGIVEERKCKVSLDMSNADRNADAGTPCDAPLEEGDLQDHASHQDAISNALVDLDPHNHAVENAGSELATNLSASSHTNVSPPASFKPVVKELQWSIFSEIYTPDNGSNALNDFLSELDAGTDEFSNQNLGYQPVLEVGTPNTNSLSNWNAEHGNFADQNITNSHHFGTDVIDSSQLHDNGGFGMHSHLNTHQSQLESFSSFHGTSEQPPGDSNVEQVGIGFIVESKVGGHSARMHLQGDHNVVNEEKQSLVSSSEVSLQYASLGDAQLGGSYTNIRSVEAHQQVYSSHQQVLTSQPWESMYPGWYFDYTTNEWKQIEGWDFTTYSTTNEHHVSSSTVVSDDYSTLSAANATLSQLNFDQGVDAMPSRSEFKERQNLIAGYNEAADVSGTIVQEQVALTGSGWPTGKEETVSTSLGSLLEGEEMNITAKCEQGNFDGASQSQMQVPWEEQYPGWYFDYQAQQWRQVIAGAFVDSYGGKVEPSVSEEDPLMNPDHQLNANQSVARPEGGGVIHGSDVSNVVTSTQNVSFHAWGASAVTTNFSDPISDKTGNVKEVFQVESDRLSYGVQSYSNGATQYLKEPETPIDNFYGLQSYSQSHNLYGAVKESKFSPDERPSHALVAFGFGGKLVTMKASFNSIPETVVLHDLNQLIQASADNSRNDGISYFNSLNRGGLAGPLVGSGVATKEVLKWVDDRIANCEMEDPQRIESLHVLWGVLRIACVHYGKVRPTTHGSSSLKSSSEDGPELDLGRLLSTSCQSPQVQGFTATSAGLQATPPEPQLQSIALEMRKRLVEGKRKEALQLAQQGQLWGPALVLASHLGEKAYAETVLQMSQQQFVPGCPLRTLFLLLGGQTGELFTAMPLPSPFGAAIPTMDSAGGMLSDWMSNLSIIAANPTNGDEQVITHLGDCLWKDHGEVSGAHTCYLVADTTFESYSENARLCLVGADHFKWQRTFATPMSIQRTELYEYAKALGNPQFILSPFQPYKLLYAYMLVEAGKVSEARRYCQAVSKALKNAGRTSEIEFCRQAASALEERLRVHSQGGYNLNSATGKLVGKFIGTLDNTLHRIIGGPPPRQASEPSLNRNRRDWYSNDQKAVNSAKVREGSTLERPVQNENSGMFNNLQMETPSRSVSEPNLSWNPEKKEHNATASSQTSQVDGVAPKENKNEVRRTGYLGRLLSTAVGFMKSNTKKADLGDNNKFYYNKELKRWVEEGAEQTVEEMALPPPPISTGFESNNGNALLDTQVATGTEGPGAMGGSISSLSQMPPLPPSGNQYSARGRLNGVRARYVDTFNAKGTPAKSTNSPLVPTSGWAMVPPPTQFFMPVQTATSTNNATKASDEELLDLSNSLSASRSTAQNSVVQTENGAVVLNETFSSFTAVSSIDKHVGVNNIIAPAQGVGGFASEATQFSSLNLAGDTTWLGKAPSFYATETSMNPMQSSRLPNDNHADVKLDSYMHTAKFPLPVPPVIQPRIPAVGVENGFSNKSDEYTESEVPNDVNEGILTDMQEVEL